MQILVTSYDLLANVIITLILLYVNIGRNIWKGRKNVAKFKKIQKTLAIFGKMVYNINTILIFSRVGTNPTLYLCKKKCDL